MSLLDALLILLAGVGAGTINSIVGSGTLITFPTLLFLGYPPLMANVSNNIGLVAGGASASWGYRTELTGHGGTLRKLVPLSLLGAVVGATLLLTLPATAFKTIVPVLIVLALVLVIFGPRLQRAAATRHTDQAAGMPPWRTRALAGGVFVGGVYGGYFGAAQGVLLMGLFSALASEPIQRLTGFKNVLVTIVNTVAAIAFLLFAREHVSWPVVGLVAVGSFIGGLLGAVIGRRLPGVVLRSVIVVVGVLAIIKMVWFA
ncbi:MAG: sulfite exporter TauE/SafE family protein [Actinomycetales bacterium]|mgnify:FL=1|uniref:Probable membrane transporter protein n=1 Tax=Candidatus Phosphoribacter hodrii TaxID=2953743 RepID=A0A934X498_9MICO|nr:sulfite exporter TauE/SafE family protein [Candidatus Phosphoribacter hodrii]MBL0002564.1 sulfite exporter TauE/SafE family protein [Candidatus Phosphoribacter hodrii]HNV15144.1 sulfite exporter TauE/SafE family protein [Dermatophilaceae bacterium]HOI04820.1 sulfite exporter TauE/SafE family protein [Dermatophilaceae bacterium]